MKKINKFNRPMFFNKKTALLFSGILSISLFGVFTIAMTNRQSSAQSPTKSNTSNPKGFTQNVVDRRLVFDVNGFPREDFYFSIFKEDILKPRLIRTKVFEEANFEVVSEKRKENQYFADELKNTEVRVVKPSYKVLKFELLDKIIAQIKGQTYVFDSDDYDLETAQKSEILSLVSVYSKNPRSINSKFFLNNIGKATKISLVFKDVNWVDHTGKKTDYKLVPEDYLFAFIREYAKNHWFRWIEGIHNNFDVIKVFETWNFGFLDTRFEAEVKLQSSDIDYSSWLTLKNQGPRAPIESIMVDGKPTKVFSVYLKPEVGRSPSHEQMWGFLQNFVINPNLHLVPSQYIAKENQKRKDIGEAKGDGIGLLKDVAYYWYGKDWDKSLYVSPFYMESRDLYLWKETINFAKNPNFVDAEWAKDPNTVRNVTYYFQSRDPKDFKQDLYNNFVSGLTSFVPLKDLEPSVASVIESGKDPNVSSKRIYTLTEHNTNVIPPFLPTTVSPPIVSPYPFNDEYSMFMYGTPIRLLRIGRAQPLKHFFGDDQISFRSILLAAVNWEKAVQFLSEGEEHFSLTMAAPYADLMGKDHEVSPIKNTADALELANSPFTVVDGKRKTFVSYHENIKEAQKTKLFDNFMVNRKVYEQLQEDMTTLLDKVYANFLKDTGRPLGGPLSFVLRWERPVNVKDVKEVLFWESLVETLNALDKKGRLLVVKPTSQLLNYIYLNYGAGATGFQPLSYYTYQGNVSYLEKMFFGYGVFYFGIFPKLIKRSEADWDNPFPMLTRLAKLFEQGVKNGTYPLLKPVEEWEDFTNIDIYYFDKKFRTEYHQIPSNVFSKFFVDAQKAFTNEELVRLNVELSVVMGPKFSFAGGMRDPFVGVKRLQQRGLHIPIGATIQDFYYDPV